MQFLNSLKEKFIKTKEDLSNKIKSIFSFFVKVDEEFLDKLEEVLITSDVSLDASRRIKDELRNRCKLDNTQSPDEILNVLKSIMKEILNYSNSDDDKSYEKSFILVVGINGVGKTTTIGKLAHFYSSEGKKVLIAAGDTFRAAATEQLDIWAQRTGCEILKKNEGADPGAVVYESISKLNSDKFDLLICDTAGRLHNKSSLMDEMKKIDKIIDKNISNDCQKQILLVLDASTGQNMINQVEEFSKILKITGLILTKLDGTAKGGALLSVREKFKGIPIEFIGVGEKVNDLCKFDCDQFVDVILENVQV